jgi:hypothetical protein
LGALFYRNPLLTDSNNHSLQPNQRKEDKMNKTQVLGIVRHLLTFGGGLVVAKGWSSEVIVTELVGGIVAIAGAIWSAYSPEKKRK